MQLPTARAARTLSDLSIKLHRPDSVRLVQGNSHPNRCTQRLHPAKHTAASRTRTLDEGREGKGRENGERSKPQSHVELESTETSTQ